MPLFNQLIVAIPGCLTTLSTITFLQYKRKFDNMNKIKWNNLDTHYIANKGRIVSDINKKEILLNYISCVNKNELCVESKSVDSIIKISIPDNIEFNDFQINKELYYLAKNDTIEYVTDNKKQLIEYVRDAHFGGFLPGVIGICAGFTSLLYVILCST